MTKTGRNYHSPYRIAQARQTRTHIVNAARELFIRAGVERTTMTQVAFRARVSRDTVRGIFGSKARLFAEVRESMSELELLEPQAG